MHDDTVEGTVPGIIVIANTGSDGNAYKIQTKDVEKMLNVDGQNTRVLLLDMDSMTSTDSMISAAIKSTTMMSTPSNINSLAMA